MTTDALRRTPLFDLHRELGARIVPFAGWEMPVQYSGILDEVRSVRTNAGLFDISHMGRAHVFGSGALDVLQRLTTNDVAALEAGRAHYTLLTNPNGGVIDDLIVYRVAENDFWVVINAGNSSKDLAWLREQAAPQTSIDDWTDRTAMIAIQGPKAIEAIAPVVDTDVPGLPGFAFVQTKLFGEAAIICRTGYTGEDGLEVIVQPGQAPVVWRKLLDAGASSCGLGARDALRIEAGYPLYGHEIDDTTTPVEAGLMWVVKLDKGEFTGRARIAELRETGAGKRLVGLTLSERIVPRQGYTVYAGELPVGTVTSGVFSPTVGHSVAMAYVDEPHGRFGADLTIEIRARRIPCRVVPKKDLRST